MSEDAATVFDLEYVPDIPLFRAAYRRWAWRAMGGYILAGLFIAFAAVWLARVYPWLSGFFCGALLVWFSGWAQSRAAYLKDLEGFRGSSVRVRLDEHGLLFNVPKGEARVAWSEIGRVDRVKDMWILRTKLRHAPIFLPTAAVPPDADAFLRERLAAHRVPVEG